jgi:HD superfamily phosphohydrolase
VGHHPRRWPPAAHHRHAPFQRLRYIKQLGHAHLVYPGATHTRFDHAVGVYHLASRALSVLGERGDLGTWSIRRTAR